MIYLSNKKIPKHADSCQIHDNNTKEKRKRTLEGKGFHLDVAGSGWVEGEV
jgi:hypothetical protein